MSLAVVSLSGGMDSCVAASIAKRDGHELAFLHAGYGQRTEGREKLAFEQIANYYGVPPEKRLVVPMQALCMIGGSSLTGQATPAGQHRLVRGGIPSTYVPFRNAHLLAACVSWAEVLGAGDIYIGVVEQDSSGYPDCTSAFLTAFERAANEGTAPQTAIKLNAPVINMTKADIVRIGMGNGAPLHLTWSCYFSEALACGRCESCILRLRGFERAGRKDPIAYEGRP